MDEVTSDQIERFVRQVIHIERKYGFELKNVSTARREEIAKWLNKFIAEECADDHTEDRA